MSRLDHIYLSSFNQAYFIGIGGIGMSALARYFKSKNWNVAGYDKTPSTLTKDLIEEGIKIHFEDFGADILSEINDPSSCLFIYTPAIPSDHGELSFIRTSGFPLFKRSEILGLITRESKGIGVAGTHGKTTTSSMLAHLLDQSTLGCSAFLGGIATNFESNLLVNSSSPYTVIEADEFDRSFLQLKPFASIITSTDSDHLDIYGDSSEFLVGFQKYARLVSPEGILVKREGLDVASNSKMVTYAIDSASADYSGFDLHSADGRFLFTVRTPKITMQKVELGIPGIHNAENALACVAMAEFLGLTEEEIRHGLKTFLGVKRRFEYHIRSEELIIIDDYAHHPTEIRALVSSVRLLYPEMKVTGVFQPHLFSRTRDFFEGFTEELSKLDEVVLMPIYPAREHPIEGVSSDILLNALTVDQKCLCNHSGVLEYLRDRRSGVILTIGAGDIDRIVEPLAEQLQ
ncbi:MAG: UDP-N-acetylmuramate--L-alanine ligase [Cryomorphaceae bacterium]|nr:UDP-N-acetylmuramate--L-alanine ligase [Cryomorphaceae bacterium]